MTLALALKSAYIARTKAQEPGGKGREPGHCVYCQSLYRVQERALLTALSSPPPMPGRLGRAMRATLSRGGLRA